MNSEAFCTVRNLSFFSIFQDGPLEPLTRTTKLDSRLPHYSGGDNAYSKKCFQNRGMDRLASIMYCFSTKPFPETGELTNSTFHSAVILSKPMHVFSAPRILFLFMLR